MPLKKGPHKAEYALWGEEKSENRWNILQRIWNIVFCTSTICAQQTAEYWRKRPKDFFDKLRKAPAYAGAFFISVGGQQGIIVEAAVKCFHFLPVLLISVLRKAVFALLDPLQQQGIDFIGMMNRIPVIVQIGNGIEI